MNVRAGRERLRLQKRVVLAFVAMVVVIVAWLAVMGYYIHQNQELARDGKQAKVGICSYKDDLGRRTVDSKNALDNARAYLREHPHGTPGISRKLIEQSIATQQKTWTNQVAALRSLAVVKCAP